MWAVMGALVWSMAASQINDPKYQMNFITVIILNLLLFFSLWKVPSITSAFLQGGVSQVAAGLGANLWDKTTSTAKEMAQLYGGTKAIKAVSALAKSKKDGGGTGPQLGSHKYKNFQNRKK